MIITVLFDRDYQNDLKFQINQTDVTCEPQGNTVTLSGDFPHTNINYLEITNITAQYRIVQITVDGDDLHELIFLSWSIDHSGVKWQPSTEISQFQRSWVLPFMSPVAHWNTIISQKNLNQFLGSDLSLSHRIFWPASIKLDHCWPKLIRDFFALDFDFGCFETKEINHWLHNHNMPWITADFGITNQIRTAMLEEARSLIDRELLPDNRNSTLRQRSRSLDPMHHKSWTMWYVVLPDSQDRVPWRDRMGTDATLMPTISEFLSSLPVSSIFTAWIACLPAGGYLRPHTDSNNRVRHTNRSGLRQIYLRLHANQGDIFKFAAFGAIPSCDLIINNKDFVHSVVNTGVADRYVLSIQFSADQSQFETCLQSLDGKLLVPHEKMV